MMNGTQLTSHRWNRSIINRSSGVTNLSSDVVSGRNNVTSRSNGIVKESVMDKNKSKMHIKVFNIEGRFPI